MNTDLPEIRPLPKWVMTQSQLPLKSPFQIDKYNPIINRTYGETLDKATDIFADQIKDSLDTGCVQLWQMGRNDDEYAEIGYVYI